jgi:phosphoglycerate dehydrogenase-like enzyme
MANGRHIVFLYKGSAVPGPILERMHAELPDSFTLTACEAATPARERRARVAEADFLIGYAVPFDDIDMAGGVRLLQLLSAGYDRLDVDALARAGIPVADNGGANGPTVAEHAVMLMLAVLRRLPLHHDALQAGEWLGMREGLSLRELRAKQVGIVGFGRIGREVARMVRGFRATPVYADAVAAPPATEAELGATRLPLEELLASSDVVSLHTPLTETTRGLIDARALGRMKRGAVLVNTGRGPVVRTGDLVDALDRGHLGGAGLDVFEDEPIGAGHPLLGRSNVVLTPHVAGTTIDTWARRIAFAYGNVQRVAAGEAALSVVNDP